MNIYKTLLSIALALLLSAIATGIIIAADKNGKDSRHKLRQLQKKLVTQSKIRNCAEFLLNYPPPKEITSEEDLKAYIKEQIEKRKTEAGTTEPFQIANQDVNNFIMDRWEHEFSISVNNKDSNEPNFKIISCGEDGQFNTEDDISNYDKINYTFKRSLSASIISILSFFFPIALYAASGIILLWRFNPLICAKHILTISILLLVISGLLAPTDVPLPLAAGIMIYGALSGFIMWIFLMLRADSIQHRKD